MNFIESGIQNLQLSIMTVQVSCTFCTQTSASFSLKSGKHLGWIDVHFPCFNHVKVRIRGALPESYLEPTKMRLFVSELLEKLHIEKDETYQATFFKATH